MGEYVFVANSAYMEDIKFENEKFCVNINVNHKEKFYLEKLVRFLNGHSGQTELYFHDGGCCVENNGRQGHYHVRFSAYDENDANESLKKFLPNYNCKEVYNPEGMDAYLDNLQHIGTKSYEA